MTSMPISVRGAHKGDRLRLGSLIQFEPFIHRHMDWRQPLDWLGHSPYLVAEKNNRVIAALACPPDPAEVSWIRCFVTAGSLSPKRAWKLLWTEAKNQLTQLPNLNIASIAFHNWFRRLLEDSHFVHTHDVVLLSWENSQNSLPKPQPKLYGHVRDISEDDFPAIQAIDGVAFNPIWRNSLSSLKIAHQQSVIATAVEDETGIVGYQISTSSPYGGHLARLAVHPLARGEGIGYALVYDALRKFRQLGTLNVTVNTQIDNMASLSLYKKANFKRTDHEYPVYQYLR